jgi:hypothetical protein
MIQCGLRNGVADSMNVFQSSRVLGAKILEPKGQLFFCVAFETSKQPLHLIKTPGEYFPVSATFSHTHPPGLPGLGLRETVASWQK